jgi:hypothetical protein
MVNALGGAAGDAQANTFGPLESETLHGEKAGSPMWER